MQSSPPGSASVSSASPAASAAHPLRTDQVEHAVEQMRERVKQNPKDTAAWAMLAHSYDMLGRRTEASATYSRLIELVPDDPQVLVDAADSMALARGGQLQGEPMKLIERALALDPKNLKALSLAGTEAFDRNDLGQAITYWQRARAQVTDEALARELDDRLARARSLQSRAAVAAAARPPAKAASGTSGSPASGASPFVSGRITLSEKLKAQIAPGDTLFIFARPVDGSRMPVALMRRQASELPLEFKLDDSMAMVPQARLSGQPRVIVGARISKHADATPKPGDLEGYSKPVTLGTLSVRVEISEVVK
jgi:cytochrome c-type biogenesis protein CcmH